MGLALFLSILASRLAITFCGSNPKWHHMLPNQFCGMSSLVLSLAVMFGKKNNNVYHFVWALGLVGALITIFNPTFLDQGPSIFYLPTISGLLHHSLALTLVVALLLLDQINITYRKWYCTLFGFTAYLSVGAFQMSVLGLSDAFHIVEPILSGTPLTAWVMAPIYLVGYGLMLLIIELVRKHKQQSLSATQPITDNRTEERP